MSEFKRGDLVLLAQHAKSFFYAECVAVYPKVYCWKVPLDRELLFIGKDMDQIESLKRNFAALYRNQRHTFAY